MIVNCTQCGSPCDRRKGDVVRAQKENRGHYCSRECVSLGAIGRTPLGKVLLELAARPCGTNCCEVIQAEGFTRVRINELLVGWFRRGIVVRSEKDTKGTGAIAFQYFTSDAHRLAWEAIPVAERPNAVRKRPHGPERPKRERVYKPKPMKKIPTNKLQLGTWARAPLEGKPVPQKQIIRTQGIALGYDSRYQVGPDEAKTFKGPFLLAGIGRYLEST